MPGVAELVDAEDSRGPDRARTAPLGEGRVR